MNNELSKKIIEKIKKLKKLQEGAKEIGSEGEAYAAAAAMQRLMLQYNVSMSEIDFSEEREVDEIVQEFSSGYTYKSIGGMWEYRLSFTLSKYNFCRCFMYGNSYKKIVFIGKQENIDNVKWLREMLSERFIALSKKRWKEHQLSKEYHFQKISKDKFQRDYLMGVTIGLDKKLYDEREREKGEDNVYGSKVNALVVRSDTAIAEYVKKMFVETQSRRQGFNNNSAFQQGYQDGRSESLHKQVSDAARHSVENNIKMIQ